MFRRVLFTIPVILLLSLAYFLFCYFSLNKVKVLFSSATSYAKLYGIKLSYDDISVIGFPFSPKLQLNKVQISFSDKDAVMSLNKLLFKYDVFSNWLQIASPDNRIEFRDIGAKGEVLSCIGKDKTGIALKFNKNPLLLASAEGTDGILDYFRVFRYEDFGIRCISKSSIDGSAGVEHISESGNVFNIELLQLEKKGGEGERGTVMKLSSLLSKYVEVVSDQSKEYPSVKMEVVVYTKGGDSDVVLDVRLEELLVEGTDFSIIADGNLTDFSVLLTQFKGGIEIKMKNYKKGMEFLSSRYVVDDQLRAEKYQSQLNSLVFNLSDKVDDNDIKILLRQNPIGVTLLGNAELGVFMKKVSMIYSPEEQKGDEPGKKP